MNRLGLRDLSGLEGRWDRGRKKGLPSDPWDPLGQWDRAQWKLLPLDRLDLQGRLGQWRQRRLWDPSDRSDQPGRLHQPRLWDLWARSRL